MFDGDILNIIGMVDESISYMFRKFDKRFGSNANPFNCWELLIGQSAAKLNNLAIVLEHLYWRCNYGKEKN